MIPLLSSAKLMNQVAKIRDPNFEIYRKTSEYNQLTPSHSYSKC